MLRRLSIHELDRAEHDAHYSRTGATGPLAFRMLAEVLARRAHKDPAGEAAGITDTEIRSLALAAQLGLGATPSETIKLVAELKGRRIDRSAPPPVS